MASDLEQRFDQKKYEEHKQSLRQACKEAGGETAAARGNGVQCYFGGDTPISASRKMTIGKPSDGVPRSVEIRVRSEEGRKQNPDPLGSRGEKLNGLARLPVHDVFSIRYDEHADSIIAAGAQHKLQIHNDKDDKDNGGRY